MPKTERTMPMLGLVALVLLGIIAGCTGSGASETLAVPTLAVLPSATTDPDVPTRKPTITPTPTLSPVPSLTPSLTPTPPPPCDVEAWWQDAEPLVVQFFDVMEVAGATGRGALSPVLLEMRQTFRTFQRAEHPDCASTIHDELALGMENVADAFNDFLSEYSTSAEVGFTLAFAHFWAAASTLYDYGIELDNRAMSGFSVGWYGMMNLKTATAVAGVDKSDLIFSAYTATRIYQRTRDAEFDITLTAIFSR